MSENKIILQQAAQIDLLKKALSMCKFDSLNMTMTDWKFIQETYNATPESALKKVLGEPKAWTHTVDGQKRIGYTEELLSLPDDTSLYSLSI